MQPTSATEEAEVVLQIDLCTLHTFATLLAESSVLHMTSRKHSSASPLEEDTASAFMTRWQ